MSFVPHLLGHGNVNPTATRMVKQLRHDSPFMGCRIDPTGRYVVAGAEDGSIQRFDILSEQKVALNGHESWVRGLAFTPNGRTLISGDYHGKLFWWNVADAQPQTTRRLDAHNGWVRAVAVHPSGNLVASCGNDQLVKIWSVGSGELVRTLRGHESHVYNVVFHPDGNHIVSADHRGVIKAWQLSDGREIRTFDAGVLHRYDNTFRAIIGGIRSMAFKSDGTSFAVAGITNVSNAFAGVGNPCVLTFNWSTGALIKNHRPRQAFQGTAWGVTYHPDGFIMAAGGGNGGAMWFWRPNEEQSFHHMTLPNNARDLDLHPQGRLLAIPFHDRFVRIYDMLSV